MFLAQNILGAGVAMSSAVLLLLPKKAEAGPAMPACLALCAEICLPTAPGGLTYAACMALCTPGCYVSCFSNETMINVFINGEEIKKHIGEVNIGDMVLTSNYGKNEYTKVLRNIKTEGNFEFMQITAQNPYNISHIQKIQVTPEHGLVLGHEDSPMTIDTAAHIQIGDTLHGPNEERLSVIDISRAVLDSKYTLETCDGTVLASDFYVTTVCNEVVAGGEHLFGSIMDEWHSNHSSLC